MDEAVENHKAGKPEDLNLEVLANVRQELEKMAATLDSARYSPSYGRFLLDWPDEHGLVDYLLTAGQEYRRSPRDENGDLLKRHASAATDQIRHVSDGIKSSIFELP